MSSHSPPAITVIVGPTGSGKTKLAIEIAKHLDGEIIGLDSIQIYNRFCIGAAKPSPYELDQVKHHLIDTRGFYNPLKVRLYLLEAKQCIDQILSKNKHVVICGGSFFYLSQLLIPTHCSRTTIDYDAGGFGIDDRRSKNDQGIINFDENDPNLIKNNPDLLQTLAQTNPNHPSFNPKFHKDAIISELGRAINPNQCTDLIEYRNDGFLEKLSTEELYQKLYKIDISHALRHRTNRRRLIRGFEIFLEHNIGPTEVYSRQNNANLNNNNGDQNKEKKDFFDQNDPKNVNIEQNSHLNFQSNDNTFQIRYNCAVICLTSSVEAIAQRCTMRVCEMTKFQLPALNRQFVFLFTKFRAEKQSTLLRSIRGLEGKPVVLKDDRDNTSSNGIIENSAEQSEATADKFNGQYERHWLDPYLKLNIWTEMGDEINNENNGQIVNYSSTIDEKNNSLYSLLYRQFTSSNILSEAYCLYQDTVYLRSMAYLTQFEERKQEQQEKESKRKQQQENDELPSQDQQHHELKSLVSILPTSLTTDQHLYSTSTDHHSTPTQPLASPTPHSSISPPLTPTSHHTQLPYQPQLDLSNVDIRQGIHPHNLANIDITRGIWQGVGFAEFLPWFKWLGETNHINVKNPCDCICSAVREVMEGQNCPTRTVSESMGEENLKGKDNSEIPDCTSSLSTIHKSTTGIDPLDNGSGSMAQSNQWINALKTAMDEPCPDLYGLTSPCYHRTALFLSPHPSAITSNSPPHSIPSSDLSVSPITCCESFHKHLSLLTLFLTPTPPHLLPKNNLFSDINAASQHGICNNHVLTNECQNQQEKKENQEGKENPSEIIHQNLPSQWTATTQSITATVTTTTITSQFQSLFYEFLSAYQLLSCHYNPLLHKSQAVAGGKKHSHSQRQQRRQKTTKSIQNSKNINRNDQNHEKNLPDDDNNTDGKNNINAETSDNVKNNNKRQKLNPTTTNKDASIPISHPVNAPYFIHTNPPNPSKSNNSSSISQWSIINSVQIDSTDSTDSVPDRVNIFSLVVESFFPSSPIAFFVPPTTSFSHHSLVESDFVHLLPPFSDKSTDINDKNVEKDNTKVNDHRESNLVPLSILQQLIYNPECSCIECRFYTAAQEIIQKNHPILRIQGQQPSQSLQSLSHHHDHPYHPSSPYLYNITLLSLCLLQIVFNSVVLAKKQQQWLDKQIINLLTQQSQQSSSSLKCTNPITPTQNTPSREGLRDRGYDGDDNKNGKKERRQYDDNDRENEKDEEGNNQGNVVEMRMISSLLSQKLVVFHKDTTNIKLNHSHQVMGAFSSGSNNNCDNVNNGSVNNNRMNDDDDAYCGEKEDLFDNYYSNKRQINTITSHVSSLQLPLHIKSLINDSKKELEIAKAFIHKDKDDLKENTTKEKIKNQNLNKKNKNDQKSNATILSTSPIMADEQFEDWSTAVSEPLLLCIDTFFDAQNDRKAAEQTVTTIQPNNNTADVTKQQWQDGQSEQCKSHLSIIGPNGVIQSKYDFNKPQVLSPSDAQILSTHIRYLPPPPPPPLPPPAIILTSTNMPNCRRNDEAPKSCRPDYSQSGGGGENQGNVVIPRNENNNNNSKDDDAQNNHQNTYFKNNTVHHCTICDIVVIGNSQLALHKKGKQHKNLSAKAKQPLSKKEQYELKQQQQQQQHQHQKLEEIEQQHQQDQQQDQQQQDQQQQ